MQQHAPEPPYRPGSGAADWLVDNFFPWIDRAELKLQSLRVKMWVRDCLRAGRFYSEPAADNTHKMLIVGNGSIARELFTNGDCAYGIRPSGIP
jgi:hypothetical protein